MKLKRPRIIRLEVTRGKLTALGALALVCGAAYQAASDKLTFTTYYPSPFGVYGNIISTQKTILARDSGNVGIGVTNPGFKLDVKGIVNAADFYKNGVPFNPGYWMASGDSIYNTNSGSVGIGLTNPAPGARLHVAGIVAAGQLHLADQVVPGAPCPADGLVARDSKGALLSCQSGIWRTASGSGGADCAATGPFRFGIPFDCPAARHAQVIHCAPDHTCDNELALLQCYDGTFVGVLHQHGACH